MEFINLNIDEYCDTHTLRLSRILDCIDSEMRIRGCGACLADLFQCAVSDNSKENVRKFLVDWQSMAIHPLETEVFNQYSESEINSLFKKYEKLYQKIYRYAGLKIPDDFLFVGLYRLIGCTSHITYPASFVDVDYFTNDKSLPLDILEILHRDGLRLKEIDEQNEEYCKAAISNNGLALQYVKDKTDALCWQAVGMNGNALEFCPIQTEELCLRAVRQKGMALRFVKKQTPFICLVAIEKDVNALQLVQKQTYKMCLAAVKLHGKALQFVHSQTDELCLAAVQSWGKALQFVKHKTPEICAEALKQSREALPFIEITDEESTLLILKWDRDGDLMPKIPYRSESFLRKAIALSPESIRHVEKTPELCMIAVTHNGYTIRHMKQTPELCWAALYENEYTFDYIKNPTREMQLYAIMRGPWLLENIQNPTIELCAVAYLYNQLTSVVNKENNISEDKIKEYLFDNKTLCMNMLSFSKYALKYIKDQTDKMCLLAVKYDGYALKYVIHQTPEIQMAAVQNNGLAIQFIPQEQQTFEVVKAAILSEPEYFCMLYSDVKGLKKYENMPSIEKLKFFLDDESIWISIVSEHGKLLQYCPIKTEAICYAAIKNYEWAFEYVPSKMQSSALKELALKTCPQNMMYVKNQTYDDCMSMFEWCLKDRSEKKCYPIIQKDRFKSAISSIRDSKMRLEFSNLLNSDYLYRHLM